MKNPTPKQSNKLAIYQAKNRAIELRSDFDKETVWANLEQISSLFSRDKPIISRHIKNIFREEKLDRKVVVAFFATTTQHGVIKGKTQTVISHHINNIFKDEEVNKKSNMQKMHIALSDKPMEFYFWFLQKAGFYFEHKINPETLATLTILVAKSNPQEKEKMIGIVLLLLNFEK